MTTIRQPRQLRPPRVPEKVEQQHIIDTLRTFRFQVYVVGHPSPNDGRKFRGTGQTPGIPDLFAFSPLRDGAYREFLWVEAKRAGGRLRPEQAEFRELALRVSERMHHVVGTLDAVIAWLIAQRWAAATQFSHFRIPKQESL